MATTLDELLVGLGFDYDDEGLEEFKEGLGDTVGMIGKLIGIATAAVGAIEAFLAVSTSATDEQGKLAAQLGISVSELDALQFAAQNSGGSIEGLNSSLENLNTKAAEAFRGTGSGVEAFGRLGISITDINGRLKSSTQLFKEVSNRIQGLSKQEQAEILGSLGLGDSIRLLQLGGEAINDLVDRAETLGTTTQQDADLAAQFQDSLLDLTTIGKSFSRILGRELIPMMVKGKQQFVEWWMANKDLIEQNIPKYIDLATRAVKLLTIAAGAWLALRLVNNIVTLATALRGLNVALLASNLLAAALPALIGGAIAAVLLLAEDAKVFFEGGDSFLGAMIEKFPKLTGFINLTAEAFNGLWNVMSLIIDGWKEIFNLIDNFSVENLKGVIKDIPGFLGDVTNLKNPDGTGILNDIGRGISNSKSFLVDKIDIFINGSGDPIATGNEVKKQLQQSSEDLDSGVDL